MSGKAYVLADGTLLLNVHTADQCAGQRCCIHNPTEHHMAEWEPRWDPEHKQMWRRCPHRLVHPDPDDLWYLRQRWGHKAASLLGIHGCDGCCQPNLNKEIRA
jgi:hypothetical protein